MSVYTAKSIGPYICRQYMLCKYNMYNIGWKWINYRTWVLTLAPLLFSLYPPNCGTALLYSSITPIMAPHTFTPLFPWPWNHTTLLLTSTLATVAPHIFSPLPPTTTLIEPGPWPWHHIPLLLYPPDHGTTHLNIPDRRTTHIFSSTPKQHL